MAQGKEQIASVEGLGNTTTQECVKSTACNATATMQSAVGTIPGWIV